VKELKLVPDSAKFNSLVTTVSIGLETVKISVPQTENAPESKEFWKFKNLSLPKVTKENGRTQESLCTIQGRPL
jgi:hypothetical protein